MLSHAFQTSGANAAPLGVWDAEAQMALLAPDRAALPEPHPTTTVAGNLSLKTFTKVEIADLYKQLVAGLVLITAKEVFALVPGITDIRIVTMRAHRRSLRQDPSRIDPGCPKSPPALNGVQWTKVDALSIVNKISSELLTRTAGPRKALAALRIEHG
jgi:hypothetical protein